MKGLFVTRTGTDIGKTYVSAAIARYLRKKDLNLAYYKAAVSGAKSVKTSDAGFVHDSADLLQDENTLLSYLYQRPLSPHLAARLENRFASMEKIKEAFGSLKQCYDYVLSEGAGGIICPVVYEDNKKIMYEDIIKELNLPCVVVADAGLGTINHTVLTVFYLKEHGIKVQGVILNNFEPGNIMHEDNLVMVEKITQNKVIAVVYKNSMELVMRYKNMEDYFDECK